MKYDSIGFDLDGTLWNSLDSITKAWDIVAEEYSVHLPDMDEMKSVMGLNRADLMNKLFPNMDSNKQNGFFEKATKICEEILDKQGGILFENEVETLEYLSKRAKLYIVSNCQEGYIESFLEFHKLKKYFTDFQCAGKSTATKGQNIKKVLERNGFCSSIYIGDTQGDCNAAAEAEIPFVFAEYGFGKADSCLFSVKGFKELTKLADDFNA